MMRRTPETIRTSKPPKHIAEIGMGTEEYFELKIYIKSIILPGTPPFEGRRIDYKDAVYRQWLNNALEEIGPRFFPQGGNELVWPEERVRITRAVHQVVRALGPKIKKNYQKLGLRVAGSEAGESVEMAQDDNRYGSGDADDTEAEEDVVMLDERVLQEELENAMVTGMMDQNDQAENGVEDVMEATAIEFEDLFALMQPEGFVHFPDLEDDYFDWDEVMDPNSSDAVRHLANLDQ